MSPPDAEVTELPSSPGARLRREREARGMSQQQAAESLNLDPTVLMHLEANDFAALGAPVFVKGHLRRYAGMLGLADGEIVSMYDRSKQQIDEPSLVPKSRLEMAPVRGKSRWPWVVGGMVTFLVAAALLAYVSKNGLPWVAPAEPESAPPVLQEVPATTGPATSPVTGSPDAVTSGPATTGSTAQATGNGTAPFTSTTTATTPGTAGTTTTPTAGAPTAGAPPAAAPALQPGQVSLQFRFNTDSWVEVFDGSGKAVLYDLGKAGSERTITATAPLSVTLGNAAGVAVAVNGRTLPPPRRVEGEVLARFSIGADGTLR